MVAHAHAFFFFTGILLRKGDIIGKWSLIYISMSLNKNTELNLRI